MFTGPETDYHPPLSQPLTTKCFGNLTNVTPAVKDAIRVVSSQFRIRMFYLAVTVSGSSFGNSAQISGADIIFAKQEHRRWRYHRRLLDYQSPFFRFKFPFKYHQIPGIIKYLQSSNSFGSLKSILSFPDGANNNNLIYRHNQVAEDDAICSA